MRRLLDSEGGVLSVFHYDEMEDKTIIQTTQDVDPILEWNKKKQTADDGYNPSRDMRHVARLPFGIIYQCLAKYGVEPRTWMQWGKRERHAFYRRIIQDPDYKYTRTVDSV